MLLISYQKYSTKNQKYSKNIQSYLVTVQLSNSALLMQQKALRHYIKEINFWKNNQINGHCKIVIKGDVTWKRDFKVLALYKHTERIVTNAIKIYRIDNFMDNVLP